MERVVESLEQTLAQVHISDGVDGLGEDHRAGELTVAVAPVVLDTLEMPLVHEDDDLLTGALVNLSEQILIALVNKNFLQSGEEDLSALDVPVDQVLIEALLCEGLWVGLSNLLAGGSELLSVEALSVHKAL